MGSNDNLPYIQICGLEAAREADLDIYDGVITIEDTTTEVPLRISGGNPRQLVLRFDDISRPIDNFVMPDVKHIQSVFNFVKKWECPQCAAHRATKARRPSKIPHATRFNQGVAIDVFMINDRRAGEEKTYAVYCMIDLASTFTMAEWIDAEHLKSKATAMIFEDG